MRRIVWTKEPNQPRERGLIATLREIAVGEEVLAPGLRTQNVGGHIRAARRGSARWYESRTIAAGALVRRVE